MDIRKYVAIRHYGETRRWVHFNRNGFTLDEEFLPDCLIHRQAAERWITNADLRYKIVPIYIHYHFDQAYRKDKK